MSYFFRPLKSANYFWVFCLQIKNTQVLFPPLRICPSKMMNLGKLQSSAFKLALLQFVYVQYVYVQYVHLLTKVWSRDLSYISRNKFSRGKGRGEPENMGIVPFLQAWSGRSDQCFEAVFLEIASGNVSTYDTCISITRFPDRYLLDFWPKFSNNSAFEKNSSGYIFR